MRNYNKPPKTFVEQLGQLKSRNLTFADDEIALHYLQNISYYRLSAYFYPLLDIPKESHIFKNGSTFEQAIQMYQFDRKFRILIFDEIERIEISFRTRIIYSLSHLYGPFWFREAYPFKSYGTFLKHLNKIFQYKCDSDEVFIKHFKHEYSDPLPPAWMSVEIISFGTLSSMYANLEKGTDKQAVADHFGIAHTVLESWLHSLVYIRNCCAHHSRLWNRELSVKPKFPKSHKYKWVEDFPNLEKMYLVLAMIRYLLYSVNPESGFATQLKDLFKEFPGIDPTAMGFPGNWYNDSFWE